MNNNTLMLRKFRKKCKINYADLAQISISDRFTEATYK